MNQPMNNQVLNQLHNPHNGTIRYIGHCPDIPRTQQFKISIGPILGYTETEEQAIQLLQHLPNW